MADLCLQQVHYTYGTLPVVRDLSLHLDAGAIGCLLGPSGCGKTTTLRLIAGFEPLDAGQIHLGNRTLSRDGYSLPAEQRQIGMVFQDYALFPHLTVAENIGFGLMAQRSPASRARVAELLALTHLEQYARQYPHQLSGGQQQRVALARALAPRPGLLLMDEPFSNLDVELRERLSLEVRALLKQEGMTALIVTHDQYEAFALADRVGVMHQGRIQQWDTPYNLYHRPANRFVADFIGQGVLVPGTVRSARQIEIELGVLEGHIPVTSRQPGQKVDVLLRPDDIIHDDASPLLAEVEQKTFRGAEFLYTLRLPGGTRALSLVPSHHDHALGEKIGIRLAADHVVAFATDG
jgi:iron(III) transport system ATP-binding protein